MSTSSHFLSSTAIPLLLTLPPLYFLYSLVSPSVALPTAYSQLASSHHESYNWFPASCPKPLVLRDYTPRELARFDGKQPDGRILLAIKGQVFDVSAGRNFYGPGASLACQNGLRHARAALLLTLATLPTRLSDGAYGNFAGRDASRGMAKQSFDEGVSNHARDRACASRRASAGQQSRTPSLTTAFLIFRHADAGQ